MGQCRRGLARKAAGPREEVNNGQSTDCPRAVFSHDWHYASTARRYAEGSEEIICIVSYDFASRIGAGTAL